VEIEVSDLERDGGTAELEQAHRDRGVHRAVEPAPFLAALLAGAGPHRARHQLEQHGVGERDRTGREVDLAEGGVGRSGVCHLHVALAQPATHLACGAAVDRVGVGEEAAGAGASVDDALVAARPHLGAAQPAARCPIHGERIGGRFVGQARPGLERDRRVAGERGRRRAEERVGHQVERGHVEVAARGHPRHKPGQKAGVGPVGRAGRLLDARAQVIAACLGPGADHAELPGHLAEAGQDRS
jgi:hypothetical protein